MSNARNLSRIKPSDTFQSGTIAYFAMSSPPADWLKCDGAAVSRATYADLFAAIGETYGAGDGSTTFTLPDLRGEFIRGFDDGRGVDSGRVFGTAQLDEIKKHTHGINLGTTSTNGNAAPAQSDNAGQGTTTTAQNSGGTETRPRNVAMLGCIKT